SANIHPTTNQSQFTNKMEILRAVLAVQQPARAKKTCSRTRAVYWRARFPWRFFAMKIELRLLSEIKPYPGNPRFNDDAVAAVAASIRAFGFRQPVVVDEAGIIIVGHTRYKAALSLGLRKVPVHVAKGLTPEQIKAYRIADNQTNRLSDWDTDRLVA